RRCVRCSCARGCAREAVSAACFGETGPAVELCIAMRDIARHFGASGLQIMRELKTAKFSIGQVVRHRLFSFRGVIFDVDPEFANTEEWYAAIPEAARPDRDQPFYHLLAENDETEYVAYVSEQNLV